MSGFYTEDSFFTLSVSGQMGLLVISATLAAFWLWLVWRWSVSRPFWQRMLIAIVAFALFDWLTPQIYYFYYMLLIDSLPLQVVIKLPPSPLEMLRLLTFGERSNLSFHSRGLLGWALIAIAALRHRYPPAK